MITTAAQGAAQAAAIARVGEARWLSFHVSCPVDRDALLVEVVQPVAAGLWADGVADRFFFIRYPEGGEHIRLRLRVAADRDAQAAADRALAGLGARCAEFGRRRPGGAANPGVVPARFEPEVERYGGPRWLPCALAFFALSSLDALAYVARWRGEPRAVQLTEILTRLARQAAGSARTAAELRGLADHVVAWRPRMAPIVARADRMFEARGAELTGRIREVLAAAAAVGATAAPGTAEAQVVHARGLAVAVDGLDGDARWRALSSQIHMTANRLGLNPPEESYLSALLCRCLDALGEELADLAVATHAPPAPPALDDLVTAAIRAAFDREGVA